MSGDAPVVAYRSVTVRVPASSGNLGPGFDSLGLALGLHDEVDVEVEPGGGGGVTVDVSGEGAASVPRDGRNLLARAVLSGLAGSGPAAEGLRLRLCCRNAIPHGRGLGSSAAATVAGLVAARGLLAEGPQRWGDAELLAAAARIEGHPDNVAPSLLGGLTVAWTEGDRAAAVRLEPALPEVVVFVPEHHLATSAARASLPAEVPHADAAANAGRVGLLVAVLTGRADPALLLAATRDRLHQPYRAPLLPDSAVLMDRLRGCGVPAVVSGAGPSVLAFPSEAEPADSLAGRAAPGFTARVVPVDRAGARLVRRTPL